MQRRPPLLHTARLVGASLVTASAVIAAMSALNPSDAATRGASTPAGSHPAYAGQAQPQFQIIDNPVFNDQDGTSVAVSGTTIAVGQFDYQPSGSPAQYPGGVRVYTYDQTSQSWTTNPVQDVSAADSTDDAAFGYSVGVSNGQLIVGAPYQQNTFPNGYTSMGAVYFYAANASGVYQQTQEIDAPAGEQSTAFGASVAVNGTHAAFTDSSRNEVYTYTLGGSTWNQNRSISDCGTFGQSVAIGSTLLVVGCAGAGGPSAYVYAVGGSWPAVSGSPLTYPGQTAGSGYGDAVATSGNVVAVTAPNDTYVQGGNPGVGTVYRYSYNGTSMSGAGTLREPADPQFGTAVGLTGANTVVGSPDGYDQGHEWSYCSYPPFWGPSVSAFTAASTPDFDTALAVDGSTAVFLDAYGDIAIYLPLPLCVAHLMKISGNQFQLAGLGGGVSPFPGGGGMGGSTATGRMISSRKQLGKGQASITNDPFGAPSQDRFTASMANAGTDAAVGAPGALGSGAVAIYKLGNASTTLIGQLQGKALGAGAEFGTAVAMTASTVAVGAPGALGGRGAIEVFAGKGGSWKQVAQLTDRHGQPGDALGASLAMQDGTIVAGEPGAGSGQGALLVFTGAGSTWVSATLGASDGAAGDGLGSSVALDGTNVVGGAPSAGGGAGAAYVYSGSGQSWTQSQELTQGDDPAGAFGTSVGISGGAIVVGAPDAAQGAGGVYEFERLGGSWWESSVNVSTTGQEGDHLGAAVGIAGTNVLAGAPDTADGGELFAFGA